MLTMDYRQKTLGHRTQCSQCHPSVTGQFCGDCLYMRCVLRLSIQYLVVLCQKRNVFKEYVCEQVWRTCA